MSIFTLSNSIVADYGKYVQSFLTINDEGILRFLEEELLRGRKLWPEPLLQLSPSYEPAATVEELGSRVGLHPDCAQVFHDNRMGRSIRLYRHQQQGIELALQKVPFVVTSGTGSGKSLIYFIPIFHSVLSGNPEQEKVRAIIVYPMNALVNSQYDALSEFAKSFRERTGRELPVRFEKYTGQERSQRPHIQQHPPHILLTNYVMLELMLVRPEESMLVDRATTALQFLVIDELHTYRGRQGADVGLLIRRLRERCGNPNLLTIGTSATMIAGKGLDPRERRSAVAGFASKLFGNEVKPDHVVEERLQRVTSYGAVPGACSAPARFYAPRPATVRSGRQHALSWGSGLCWSTAATDAPRSTRPVFGLGLRR